MRLRRMVQRRAQPVSKRNRQRTTGKGREEDEGGYDRKREDCEGMGMVAVASLRQQQAVVFVLRLLSRQSLLLAWFHHGQSDPVTFV